ncbi:amidohydrolase [Arenibacter sp. F26102]|uniref:amidohydrolase n=1 Tax=Arenibacter sp. F26102 TaxID=2926416 RepID=UPI001FF4375B|nr:amidohydrolase [Arenibacter sp. F26102]MCK0147159.1 amidohydrolase [Arenibacter sp. F26102]
MKKQLLLLFFCVAVFHTSAQKKPKINANKKAVISSVERKANELTALSDKIWAYEEVALQEEQSSAALMAYAENQGFKITKNVGGLATAFIAEYGSGAPIIGILGEFDALPGLSQKTVPYKDPVNEGGAGHGCGHNLFGVASLGAATIIKEQIESGKLNGTVRFYGTPAEEKYFGKLWMLREGAFNDLDIMMDWHPDMFTKVDVQAGLALVDFIVEFEGTAAHASGEPWNGRSAVDGLELYTTGINYYREHMRPSARVHYQIMDAGKVVNVVPDYAKIWTRVRDTNREGMEKIWKHVEEIARGAAIMANVDYKISLVSGVHEVLVNRTGAAAMQKNIEYLGELDFTEDEIVFAKKLQESTKKPQVGFDTKIYPMEETLEHLSGGSTDVGDVSWVVPTIRLAAITAPQDIPWHSWAVVACSGMSIDHKGMLNATKVLTMTMVDVFENAKLREEVKAEYKKRKGDYVYKGMVPDGPPPKNDFD